MLRSPTAKNLEAHFPGKGRELRDLLTGKRKTMTYVSVQEWCGQCWYLMNYTARLMYALNEILEGYGVEPIWGSESDTQPIAEYVNMGDTYNTTLLLDYDKDRVVLTSLGDWVEKNERRVEE